MGSLLRLYVRVRGSSHIPYGGSPPQKILCLCSSSLLLPCFCGYESARSIGDDSQESKEKESMENLGMMPRRASPRPPWRVSYAWRGSCGFARCVNEEGPSTEVR